MHAKRRNLGLELPVQRTVAINDKIPFIELRGDLGESSDDQVHLLFQRQATHHDQLFPIALRPPLEAPPRRVTVNGAVVPFSGEELVIRRVPADVLFERP